MEMVKNHLLRDSGRSTGFPDRDLALSNARRTERRRLLRRHIVGSRKYLGESAWDMLIDLFIQHCEERKIANGDLKSEWSRGGIEVVSRCRSRWSPIN